MPLSALIPAPVSMKMRIVGKPLYLLADLRRDGVASLHHVLRVLQLAYNLLTLSRPAGIVSIFLLFVAAALPLCAQDEQVSQFQASHLLLIMPFENLSGTPGLDWVGEAFPEVLGTRLNAGALFVISRDDRLSAFDRLGIPASAKPSRATVYQVAQALDADYVLMGDFRLDGVNLLVRARLMDMAHLRLLPELAETGSPESLISLQAALAWDVLSTLKLAGSTTKEQFIAQSPAMRVDALENYVRGVTAGNDQEKIKRFKQAVALDPNNSPAILQLGKACYAARDYASALAWLGKVARNSPNYNEAQFYLGLSAFYSDQLEKADLAFRTLSRRLPLTEIHNNLGVVAARRGQPRALAYFQRTVQTDPSDPDYRFNLGVALYRSGDSQGAARELRAALALHSDAEAKGLLDSISAGAPPPARLPLERIKRNYDESSFRQLALEIGNAEEVRLQKMDPPHHAAFHVQRGEELLGQGVTSEAEKQFREAIVLDPTNAGAHAGLARVLEENQDAAGARNEARAALRLKPLPEAYLVLARLDLAESNAASAEQNLDQALALDPANAAAASLKHELAAGKQKPQQP
ncbi:MAG TPA: tetratricopeptide repeat protein [Candidatus Angelobacter sp.]